MISRLWTAFLLTLVCASAIAWLVALMREKGLRPARRVGAVFRDQPYAPDWRVWLNCDPIEEMGGVNLYALCANNPMSRHDAKGQSWLTCFGDCVAEWRLDWSEVFTSINVTVSANAPVPKTGAERLWLDKGVSENTTELSRAISQGERLARKLPLGSPVRSKIIQSLGNVRRFMRDPALVRAGAAGAAFTVFEGFYDIGTMLYCSIHCCGE